MFNSNTIDICLHIVFTVWILFYLCQTILVLLHCDKTLISFVKVWCTKSCLEIFSVYLSPKNVYNFYSIENISLTYDLSHNSLSMLLFLNFSRLRILYKVLKGFFVCKKRNIKYLSEIWMTHYIMNYLYIPE